MPFRLSGLPIELQYVLRRSFRASRAYSDQVAAVLQRSTKSSDPPRQAGEITSHADAISSVPKAGQRPKVTHHATIHKENGAHNSKPSDAQGYLLLIRRAVDSGRFQRATILFNQLSRNKDLEVDQDVCNEMLRAKVRNGESQLEILDYMAQHGIPRNLATEGHIFDRATSRGQIEFAILQSMQGRNVRPPSMSNAERFMRSAADMGEVRLSVNLFLKTETKGPVAPETLVHLLRAAADKNRIPETEIMWQRCVHNDSQLLDEGTCLSVLQCAARHGLFSLALEVLQMLRTTDVPRRLQHLIPVFEAYLAAGKVQDALRFVEVMVKEGGEEALKPEGVIYSLRNYIARPGRAAAKRLQQEAKEEGVDMPEWTEGDRLNNLIKQTEKLVPVHRTLHDALVLVACQLKDYHQARLLLDKVQYFLGPGAVPSVRAVVAVIHTALDSGIVPFAQSLYEEASQEYGTDEQSPLLLEAGLRIALMSIKPNDRANQKEEAISGALQMLDDLKNLELPHVPSRKTYVWLCEVMARHQDGRLIAVAFDMVDANLMIPWRDLKTWGSDVSDRVQSYIMEKKKAEERSIA